MNRAKPTHQRMPLLAANWKMNTTLAEGMELCRGLRERLDGLTEAEVVLCPPYTHLAPTRDLLATSSILLGAQNMFWAPKGAYTGEISAEMLKGLADYVIVGHSERRALFGESDEIINLKLRTALLAGLRPIFCVGETGEERASGRTELVLQRQVRDGLAGIDPPRGFVVAYEPVWAIGTGASADGAQAQESISFIRGQLRSISQASEEARILYGGSVTAINVAEFMRQPDIDGALVGGASLAVDSFAGIVSAAIESRRGSLGG